MSRPRSSEPTPARSRRIAVVTGTRAEFGLLVPVLTALREHPVTTQLIATGMHLRPEFGDTIREIAAAGFSVDREVAMDGTIAPGDIGIANGDGVIDAETLAHLESARSIGIGVEGLARAFCELESDIVVVLGDRTEAFAAATACAALNRVVAHIHGGDRTRGGLDESLRHAITKLAHVHFPATMTSRERIVRMGEAPALVYRVGAPGLDAIDSTQLPTRTELERELGIELGRGYLLVVQHPVTTSASLAGDEMAATLDAAYRLSLPVVIVEPNGDAGHEAVRAAIDRARGRPRTWVYDNLNRKSYLGLLHGASCLVGNSSSGIIEAPFLEVPVVDIGSRQSGRERADGWIMHVAADADAIETAIRHALALDREALRGRTHPYGDGHAGQRIAAVLATIDLESGIQQKQICY